MRAVTVMLLGGTALAIAGCRKDQNPDQNVIIENGIPANADIEALPPDESSATSSNELVNGTDNPDVNDLGNTTNAQ